MALKHKLISNLLVTRGRKGPLERSNTQSRSTLLKNGMRIDAPLAAHGQEWRRFLSLGYRALKAVPKLRDPRFVARKIGKLRNYFHLSGRLPVYLSPKTGVLTLGWPDRAAHSLFKPICFPSFDPVVVSIVIAVPDDFEKTRACLESIIDATTGSQYEVIVVDDKSTDKTLQFLSRVSGITRVRNEQSSGIAASRNLGAGSARGQYLLFLAHDTIVTPGWLTALAHTFENLRGAGLVGAKLILPDDRLEEAGAAIWRDGTRMSYGKFGDRRHPSFNFPRQVDCCAGNCLMVPRSLFFQLGGFDTRYRRDDYCAADFAFKVRRAGHNVVYQPLAEVICQRSPSSDATEETDIDGNDQLDQSIFRDRWRSRLDSFPEPKKTTARIVHSHGPESKSRGQVLVIDHRIPTPDRDCGSLRMMEIMRGFLRRGHHVTLVPDNMMVFSPYFEDLQASGIEVVYPPYYTSVGDFLEQHGRDFDLAIISRADVADRHMTTVRQLAPRAKVVFDTVDLHFLREERQAELEHGRGLSTAAARRKDQELRLARSADRTLVVSPIEKAVIERECRDEVDVRIMPTIYPIGAADSPRFADRRDIVFIGGFDHAPNIDAVLYFAGEIFPRIRESIPTVVFQVIGPDPPHQIRQLASSGIQIAGFVPDVKPLFDRARVAVAPIRYGAGVKGKVNQSMSFGVPTVVTSVAAEGMYLEHERSAMIADDPESFANAVVRLWTSPELWQCVSTNGLNSLKEHFSIEAASKPIDELLLWAGLPLLEGAPLDSGGSASL